LKKRIIFILLYSLWNSTNYAQIWLTLTRPDTRDTIKIDAAKHGHAQAKIGNSIAHHLKELGIEGNYTIIASDKNITADSTFVKTSEGKKELRAIIGKFKRYGAEIWDYTFSNSTIPIGSTPNHPFYSLDRRGYIPIGDMRLGERLQTYDGSPCSLVSKSKRPKGDFVYNLEIEGVHNYWVGSPQASNEKDMLLVHNSCFYFEAIASEKRYKIEVSTSKDNTSDIFTYFISNVETNISGKEIATNKKALIGVIYSEKKILTIYSIYEGIFAEIKSFEKEELIKILFNKIYAHYPDMYSKYNNFHIETLRIKLTPLFAKEVLNAYNSSTTTNNYIKIFDVLNVDMKKLVAETALYPNIFEVKTDFSIFISCSKTSNIYDTEFYNSVKLLEAKYLINENAGGNYFFYEKFWGRSLNNTNNTVKGIKIATFFNFLSEFYGLTGSEAKVIEKLISENGNFGTYHFDNGRVFLSKQNGYNYIYIIDDYKQIRIQKTTASELDINIEVISKTTEPGSFMTFYNLDNIDGRINSLNGKKMNLHFKTSLNELPIEPGNAIGEISNWIKTKMINSDAIKDYYYNHLNGVTSFKATNNLKESTIMGIVSNILDVDEVSFLNNLNLMKKSQIIFPTTYTIEGKDFHILYNLNYTHYMIYNDKYIIYIPIYSDDSKQFAIVNISSNPGLLNDFLNKNYTGIRSLSYNHGVPMLTLDPFEKFPKTIDDFSYFNKNYNYSDDIKLMNFVEHFLKIPPFKLHSGKMKFKLDESFGAILKVNDVQGAVKLTFSKTRKINSHILGITETEYDNLLTLLIKNEVKEYTINGKLITVDYRFGFLYMIGKNGRVDYKTGEEIINYSSLPIEGGYTKMIDYHKNANTQNQINAEDISQKVYSIVFNLE
jgi:hypothetical protein